MQPTNRQRERGHDDPEEEDGKQDEQRYREKSRSPTSVPGGRHANRVRQKTEHGVSEESEQRPPPVLPATGTTGKCRILLEAPLDCIDEADAVVGQLEGWRR